jgi:membrane protease YdiL (CAAX protease family)
MSVFLDYAARGKTAWWRYPIAVCLSLVLSAVALVVVYLPLLLLHAVPSNLAQELVQPSHPVVFFIGTGVEFGLVLLGFMGAIGLMHRKSPGDVIGRWPWRLVFLGAGLWLAVQAVAAGADAFIAPGSFALTLSPATGPLAAAAILGLGVQTFAEEFVFRGYLTQALLLAVRRPWIAALISGLLFGALHIPNGIPQAVNAVVFGTVTALLAIRAGGIAFTFGLHVVNNIFGAVLVVSSADVFHGSPGVFTQTAPQLLGWDVAVGTVALLAVLWFTRRWSSASPPARPPPPASSPRST